MLAASAERLLEKALERTFGTMDAQVVSELMRIMKPSRLERGAYLFHQGSSPTAMYVLKTGRLEVVRVNDGKEQVLGEVAPGESVGELGVLTGEPRGANVRALRACELLSCSADDFAAFAQSNPRILLQMSKLIAHRASGGRAHRRVERGATVALIARDRSERTRSFLRLLRQRCAHVASLLLLDDASPGPASVPLAKLSSANLAGWCDACSAGQRWVVLVADAEASDAWVASTVRHADRVVVVGDAQSSPSLGAIEACLDNELGGARVPRYLVRVHAADTEDATGTNAWIRDRERWVHRQVRQDSLRDASRILRELTDSSIGLVLGGGGARGAAHFGVLRAFEECNIPVDHVCGVSAGGGVAALLAMGLSPDRVRDRIHKVFIEDAPFRSMTLPVYSLFAAEAMDKAAHELVGDRRIEDLWLDYSTSACDISSASRVVLSQGSLARAIRATTAVPGIMPPVTWGEAVLVDGGILSNVPVQDMRQRCNGHVIAVDVSPTLPLPEDSELRATPRPMHTMLQRFGRKRQRAAALPIVETLVRATAVAGVMADHRARAEADLWLQPPVEAFSVTEFSAMGAIAEAAYHAVITPLSAWAKEHRTPLWDPIG